MAATASQITSLTIVYSTVYSGADKRKHQSSASLDFVWGIQWWPVNSPHKWPVTRKMFPLGDVVMIGNIIDHEGYTHPCLRWGRISTISATQCCEIKKCKYFICFPKIIKARINKHSNYLIIAMIMISITQMTAGKMRRLVIQRFQSIVFSTKIKQKMKGWWIYNNSYHTVAAMETNLTTPSGHMN